MNHKANKRFLVEYRYADATWALEIWADDWQDAERKLRALGANGRVVGEDAMLIKLPNWMERVIGWLLGTTPR